MRLKKISIINYKNIKSTALELSPKVNCFIGNNGEGKTNILDAVYFLSFCHSNFTNIDYEGDEGQQENIYAAMKRGRHKQFKRNHKDYKKLSAHIGLIPLIFVTPSDNSLVSGTSEERRRLMDVVIAQYDHTYMDALTRYNKALQQRNALLKMETEPDASLMDLWEEE